MEINTETQTQEIGGVTHTKDNNFNYHNHGIHPEPHPLGTVYRNGKFGYVASGYDWWRFEINKLATINRNH